MIPLHEIPAPLYHYTCAHQISAIREAGELRPTRVPGMAASLLWLTDLEAANRYGLGLTSNILVCDRTQHRLIVPHPAGVHRWIDVKRDFPAWWSAMLEAAPGVLPMHWYVTYAPQQIAREAA